MKTISSCLTAFILFPLLLSSCSNAELETVKEVDLDRYMGKWFEIAALPGGIQKGCTCTAFDYKLSTGNDFIMVINSCIKKGKQGAALAKAFPDKNSGNSQWKMQLFWPFTTDYYIVALAEDYSYAMAGHPDRKSLWILSRDPVMDSTSYNLLVERATILGFDTSGLIKTVRDCNLK